MKLQEKKINIVCQNKLKKQCGLALIEVIPLIIIFSLLLSYSTGFVASIHKSILFSTAARLRAIQRIENRSDSTVMYFLDIPKNAPKSLEQEIASVDNYKAIGFHWHGIVETDREAFVTTKTPPSLPTTPIVKPESPLRPLTKDEITHLDRITYTPPSDFNTAKRILNISPKVGYGFCVTATCGQ